jgi:hypothetical protein
MEAQTELKDQLKKNISSIPNIVIEVVKNPVGFFRGMPRTGGFFEPLVFMIVMGVAGGIIRAFFGLLGLGFMGSFLMALASIVIVPIMVVIFGFVWAGIVFVIWKIMGSQQSFETAYRCIAYAGAITPLTAVLNIIPYIGGVLGLVWMTYLIVTASVEVHSIKPKVAWAVFGAIGLIFAIFSISAQYSQRQYYSRMQSFHKGMEKNMGNLEDMTPEEQGRALGEFLKGMQKAAEAK